MREHGGTRHPIVAHYWPVLSPADRKHVSECADRIRAREPHLASVIQFGELVYAGYGDFPVVHIHDASSTITAGAPVAREHRAFLLAEQEDCVVTGTPAIPAFVDYCRQDLGLGQVSCLSPAKPPRGRSLAARCIQDRALVERLVNLAREAGGLNLSPYISTGGTWALAGILSSEAKVQVFVSAAPPRLAQQVNNKVWFSRAAVDLLGGDALPLSIAAHSWTGLSYLVRQCADRYPSVGIKLPSDAGSAGNLVLDSGDLEKFLTLRALRGHLKDLFAGLGWDEPFPTLVSVWEQSVISSPSVQMWIPNDRSRNIVVEGVFDQRVEGSACHFVGCEPSSLCQALKDRLAHEAALFGTLFQDLGYYGRCSLDSIIVGESQATANIHWVECNGRWGGTSIPMTLVNRLVGDWMDFPMTVLGGLDTAGDGRFEAILNRTRDQLFSLDRLEGLVFLSPGPDETGRGQDFMALGGTIGRARSLLRRGVDTLATEPVLSGEPRVQRRQVQAGSV